MSELQAALKFLSDVVPDPKITALVKAKGAIKVEDIATSADLTEAQKTAMLAGLGYKYP